MNIISFLDIYNSDFNYVGNLNTKLSHRLTSSKIWAYVDSSDTFFLNSISSDSLSFLPIYDKSFISSKIIPNDLMATITPSIGIMSELTFRFKFSESKSGKFNHILQKAKLHLSSAYFFIEDKKIDTIIFFDSPHTPLEYSYYIIAKNLSIRTIFFNFFPIIPGIPELCFLSSDLGIMPYTKSSKNSKQSEKFLFEKIQTTFKSNLVYLSYTTSLGSKVNVLAKKILWYAKNRKFTQLISKLLNLIFNKFVFRPLLLFNLLKIEKDIELLDFKYVFYPLHYQPEATTLPNGGIYSDQEYLIGLISKNLPENITLIVKEHPAYFKTKAFDDFSKYRDLSFYKRINNYENVRLIKTFSDTSELIKKSLGVITVTGTVAWEALLSNRYCMVFGTTYYKYLPNSLPVDNEETIFTSLNYMVNNYNDFKSDTEKLISYVSSIGAEVLRHPEAVIKTNSNLTQIQSDINIIDLLMNHLDETNE